MGHSGTKRTSTGPQDVSETAPSGQCKDRIEGTFPKNLLCGRPCYLGIGSLQQPSDVGRIREHESLAQSYVVSKWLSWYLNAQACVTPKPSRDLTFTRFSLALGK